MRQELENIGHGCVRSVGGCIVARYGEWFYSAGDTVNVLTNTPRTLWGMLEFIGDHQAADLPATVPDDYGHKLTDDDLEPDVDRAAETVVALV